MILSIFNVVEGTAGLQNLFVWKGKQSVLQVSVHEISKAGGLLEQFLPGADPLVNKAIWT